MVINVDYKSGLKIDKCLYTGNMFRIKFSSAEELRFVTSNLKKI